MPAREREKQNFDLPSALDRDLLKSQLYTLANGDPVDVPCYDFTNHTRLPKTRKVEPCGKTILVEGLFALYWGSIRPLYAKKIFIDINDEERLMRRISRDTKDRQRNVKSIEEQYEKFVIPMYEKYIKPSQVYADLCVRGDLSDDGIKRNILIKIVPSQFFTEKTNTKKY